MIITKTVETYVSADVDIDMDEFDTEELIEELERRKIMVYDPHEHDDMLEKMHVAYSHGKTDELIKMMPEFFWRVMGRLV